MSSARFTRSWFRSINSFNASLRLLLALAMLSACAFGAMQWRRGAGFALATGATQQTGPVTTVSAANYATIVSPD